MEREQAPDQLQLTGIHINLADHAIRFEDRPTVPWRLRFTGEAVLS